MDLSPLYGVLLDSLHLLSPVGPPTDLPEPLQKRLIILATGLAVLGADGEGARGASGFAARTDTAGEIFADAADRLLRDTGAETWVTTVGQVAADPLTMTRAVRLAMAEGEITPEGWIRAWERFADDLMEIPGLEAALRRITAELDRLEVGQHLH